MGDKFLPNFHNYPKYTQFAASSSVCMSLPPLEKKSYPKKFSLLQKQTYHNNLYYYTIPLLLSISVFCTKSYSKSIPANHFTRIKKKKTKKIYQASEMFNFYTH